MAWLEQRRGCYRIIYRFNGRRCTKGINSHNRRDAELCLARFEENLLLVERGRLVVPPGTDLGLFLLSDGKLEKPADIVRVPTLREMFERYQMHFTLGAKEDKTRKMEVVHMNHLLRLIGSKNPITEITTGTIQHFVDRRSRELHKGQPVKAKTVRKAVATLRYVWNWSFRQGTVSVRYPATDLIYAKERQPEPFRTYEQIQAIISRIGTSDRRRIRELWDGLFLNPEEIAEVLEVVRRKTKATWLYPFLVCAAYTGARRGELFRAKIEDFDFESKHVLLREKKRSRQKETYRTVDMTAFLETTLRTHLELNHPGGEWAFCTQRDSSITDGKAWRAFRTAVKGSKWEVLRGFHAFRHSFASNLAAAGVDSRIICEVMGHQTEEMEARYRHLFPAQRRAAIASVFDRAAITPSAARALPVAAAAVPHG